METLTKPIQVKAVSPETIEREKVWSARTLKELIETINTELQKFRVSRSDWVLQTNESTIAGVFI